MGKLEVRRGSCRKKFVAGILVWQEYWCGRKRREPGRGENQEEDWEEEWKDWRGMVRKW